MSEVNTDSCIVLADKISKLLVNNGLNLEKNYEKNFYNNKKYLVSLLKELSYPELKKCNILINDILNEKEVENSNILFDEFATVFTQLKENNFETRYLEKVLKNFSEDDYSESIVNIGRALESLSKTILNNEKSDDNLGRLIYLLDEDGIITKDEKNILERIRECRNKNAHGEEWFVEVSKQEAENYILLSFEIMKNLILKM